jgi:hypothetical protein
MNGAAIGIRPADLPLWERFSREARRQRRDPVKLLLDFMQDYLEICEDQKLHREMQKQARRSGYKPGDAVRLAREVRRELRNRRGAS